MKRFYNTAHHALQDNHHYYFYLDNKPIKTPTGTLMSTPSLKKADAVVAEWHAQADNIIPQTMPITQYLNSVIDKIIPNHASIIEQLLSYADNDCIFYFTHNTDTDLYKNQTEYWLPIIHHFEKYYAVNLNYGSDLILNNQSDIFKNHLQDFFKFLPHEELAGLYTLITIFGSVLLGLYAYQKYINYDTALFYSRLEEDYNIKNWGLDLDSEKNRHYINQDFQNAVLFLGL